MEKFGSQVLSKLLRIFHKGKKLGKRGRQCLYPNCGKRAVDSHTVQKRGPIGLLACCGHVIQLKADFARADLPVTKAELVGVNAATTFPGFCPHHDQQVFKCIEEDALDPENPQHKMILCYRIVARKHWHCRSACAGGDRMAAAVRSEFPDVCSAMSGEDIISLRYKNTVNALASFKECFDELLASGSRCGVLCFWTKLIDMPPGFAGGACIHLPNEGVGDDAEGMAEPHLQEKTPSQWLVIVVHPMEKSTLLVACRHEHCTSRVINLWECLSGASQDELEQFVSELMLRYGDTLVFSPQYWESLGNESQDSIVAFRAAVARNAVEGLEQPRFPECNANLFAATRG